MGQQSTLAHTVLVCCLLSLLLAHLSQGKRDNSNRAGKSGKQARANRCKNKTTFTVSISDLQRTPMTFKCPRSPVVTTKMQVIKGKCRGTTGFTRWTVGRCLWNQTCHMTYRNQVIDSLAPKVKDKACLGQVPEKLEIWYTCLKKKVTVTDTLGTFKKTRKRMGVVRSHKLFPWSYRNGDELGNVTFLRPRKPAGLTTLWISVHFYDLLTSDLLFLSWEERTREGGGQRVRGLRQLLPNDTLLSLTLPDLPAVTFTFYADYRHEGGQPSPSASQGARDRGFLLCYQWLKPNIRPKKDSACSKMIIPAKCKTKRRSGRRKAGSSRPGSNNRRSRNKQKGRGSKRARNSRPRSRPNRHRPEKSE